jgi:GR25 family glycosyltransferase involved in LPS biosynthesis
MKAFIITLPDPVSKKAAQVCQESANFEIETFDATTPTTLVDLPGSWTYPTHKDQERWIGDMYITAYNTKVLEKRIACFMSHYRLWKKCFELDETIMILEHDAVFVRKFDYSTIRDKFTGSILGINDPTKATRKYKVFDNNIKKQYNGKEIVVETPWVDDQQVPQGLAGNSAYIVKPKGAQALLELVKEYGMWPNDAIMCKQLMPGHLQCVYPYYTKVQRLESTTTR